MTLSHTSHNNQSLFSDHYLNEILRRDKVWRAAVPQAQAFLSWLRELYAREKEQLTHYNESQLEDKWFQPIFARLGYAHWEVQATIPGWQGKIKKPDYFFFPTMAAQQTAVSQQNTVGYASAALAVAEVKQWEINLSKKTGSQPNFESQNPMYQIDSYLSLTGVAWGILSNGRWWRLLHKSSSRTLETYFEIDLLAALEQSDETKATAVMLYFWLFFNQTAFHPNTHGRIFLDEALEQSRSYALALEADLRDNAYRALEQLIIGFFAGDNTLNAADPIHRDEVYHNSLYLLYRLLFIFYGESRALLPMANTLYKEQYALQQLAQKIDGRRNTLPTLPTTGRIYWNQLQETFRLISGIDRQLNIDLGVPRYNGGLFSAQQHPFLETHFVGDRALALAIDYLATRRIVESNGLPAFQRVDYGTLDVRQLGSIYEGLLEYKVVVATEEMVTITKSGVETWVPLAQKGKSKSYGERRQEGELYLTNDKGERKATGSYYTPDYIVEYIVANTLGPLVEQARDKVRTQVREAGRLDETTRQQKSAVWFTAEILRLNVLDPAMGSGHFLVEATNYLARVLATDAYISPELSTADTPPHPTHNPAEESDLLYWKRRVVEACIYGVDKNPMAVELAKLSLWLKTAASDKPLSFLDHHLQHGDSLIGAWFTPLDGERPQGFWKPLGSFTPADSFTRDTGLAVQGMATIANLPTLDIETVHAKEEAWQAIQQTHLGRWRQLADLWVSRAFGHEISDEALKALATHGHSTAAWLQHPTVQNNDYFHWELAFPEVFFDAYGRPLGPAAGFDAIVGNPPYVRQEQLAAFKPFFTHAFADVYAGTADLFVYFFKQALTLLRQDGLTSYISSNSWLRANYATLLRAYLRQHATLQTIIDLGDNRVFADAPDLYPAIHIVCRRQPSPTHTTLAASFNRGEGLANFQEQLLPKLQSVAIHNQADSGWQLDDSERTLFEKLMAQGEPLASVVDNRIYYGVKTGFNEAFVINEATRHQLIQEDPASAEIIKPMLRGADLRPWYQSFTSSEGEYLIFTRRGIDIEQYPAIKAHLNNYRTQLEPRPVTWSKNKKWPGRKVGTYQWYEIQDSVDYYQAFNETKIFWPELAKTPRFSWDTEGAFTNNKGYILPTPDIGLVGLLNSRITWFVLSKIGLGLGERAGLERFQLFAQYTSRIPIPNRPSASTTLLAELSTHITYNARARYQLHQQIRHRILTDLGTENHTLNNALHAWWELDFPRFRTQIKSVFKQDIPLKERHDWEAFLSEARQQHHQLTAAIMAHETTLNQHIYTLFHLTPAEIKMIEASTKYNYGEL